MFKKILLSLSLMPMMAQARIAQEGHYLLKPRAEWLSQIKAQKELIVDHVGQHGLEIYGPVGLGVWLKSIGVPEAQLLDLDQPSDSDMDSEDGLKEKGLKDDDAFGHSDNYANYQQITNFLQLKAKQFPNLIQVFSIGKSQDNRDLWMVKISDQVQVDEQEPEFKYVANMHGDEIVGKELMLRLIDDLLTKYQAGDETVRELVNNTEIYIMPTMNPDGMTKRSRGNAYWIDLNRDFPDFSTSDDQNQTGTRAPETQAMMRFEAQRQFALSANFHGGAVCFNYPWDTSPEKFPFHSLVTEMAKEYADQVPDMRNSTEFSGGITNGYQWYEVNGGMQDWSYFWHNDLQVTIELSEVKWPGFDTVDYYYRSHYPSLLQYIKRVHQGAGFKTQSRSTSGNVTIKLERKNRSDKDLGTFSFSGGEFYKVLPNGSYTFEVSTAGGKRHSFSVQVDYPEVHENGNYQLLLL